MNTFRRIAMLVILAPAAAFCVLGVAEAGACPGCKDAVPTEATKPGVPATGRGQTLAPSTGRGYNYSIFLMMAAPYVLLGAFGGGLYLTLRKSATKRVSPSGAIHANERR